MSWYDRKRLADLETYTRADSWNNPPVNMGFLAAESSLVASGSQLWEINATSADQTNTVGAPAFVGQILQFYASKVAASGVRTITTLSGPFTGSGHNTMTFAASGGFISLRAMTVDSLRQWMLEYFSCVSITAV